MGFKSLFAVTDPLLLVEMDFSQLEVCGLAEITQDPVLIKELNAGVDIHTENAKVWKKRDTITPEERKAAKVLTFQLQYGAGANKMAESTGLPRKEVVEFMQGYYDKYNEVLNYHDELSIRKNLTPIGTDVILSDIAGRTYRITPKTDPDKKESYISMPELKNYPIQGFSTGTIVPMVTNMISRNLRSSLVQANIINTVHDSLMFEVYFTNLNELFLAIEQAFIDFPARFKKLFDYDLKVRYNYDIKVGPNWEDMDTYTRADIREHLLSGGYL